MKKSWPLLALLALTNPDNATIFVSSDQVVYIEPGGYGYCERRALTHVATTTGHLCVKEGAGTIAEAIRVMVEPHK